VIKKCILGLFCCLFIWQISYAEPLSSVEKEMVNYIQKNSASQISLLEKIVNINSGTQNPAGVYQVGEILRPSFEAMGFKTQWAELPPSMKHAGALIAEHKGCKNGNRILLIGHLDTVFPGNSTFQKFERHGNIATGPGVIDDKGSVLVMLYALKALDHANGLNDATITVVLMGDEEDSAKPTTISRKSLIELGKKSDIALDFEPGTGLNLAAIARRGISSFTIAVTGSEAHSSVIFSPDVGYGSSFELARIVDQIRTQLSKEKYLTISPNMMLSGTLITHNKNFTEAQIQSKNNIVAKNAVIHSDLRFISGEQQIMAENKIKKIVANHLPGTKAEVSFLAGIPAMPPTLANRALLKKLSSVNVDLGLGSVEAIDPGARGAGDISHVASVVSANLVGLGAVGNDMHTEKESIDLASLPLVTERAAIFIYRLTQS